MTAAAPRPCPVCSAQPPPETKTLPFCSARCQWVDLGRWLDGDYVVPGEDAVGLEQIVEYEMRKGREERADAGD